jgi:hypothetical protein
MFTREVGNFLNWPFNVCERSHTRCTASALRFNPSTNYIT